MYTSSCQNTCSVTSSLTHTHSTLMHGFESYKSFLRDTHASLYVCLYVPLSLRSQICYKLLFYTTLRYDILLVMGTWTLQHPYIFWFRDGIVHGIAFDTTCSLHGYPQTHFSKWKCWYSRSASTYMHFLLILDWHSDALLSHKHANIVVKTDLGVFPLLELRIMCEMRVTPSRSNAHHHHIIRCTFQGKEKG